MSEDKAIAVRINVPQNLSRFINSLLHWNYTTIILPCLSLSGRREP
jgi:hypothetical protein